MNGSVVRAFVVAAGAAAVALTGGASAQVFDFDNVVLLSHEDRFEGYNDVWGFVGNDGREYLIQGLTTGTAWWDVEDPVSPVLVGMIPGPASGWRDMFVIGDWCYVGTEGGGGIQIIDISDPTNPTLVNVYDATVSRTHNIFGDPSRNLLFTAGGFSNGANGGIQILDTTDPVNLVEISRWSNQYVHDLSLEGTVIHACLIYPGKLRLIDISDSTNPTNLGNAFTDPSGNVHASWPFGDGAHLMIAEEKIGGHVKALDISDPFGIFITDVEDPEPGASAHNVHVEGDKAYVAWYARGTRILDVSDPFDLVEVGYWDTYPSTDGGGVGPGNWGVYPHLPSGLIASNDRPSGLFLLRYDPDAGTLNGTVFSSEGGVIPSATVEYQNHGITQTADTTGGYKFSVFPGAGHRLRFSAYGFVPDSATVAVGADGTTTTNMTLTKLPAGSLAGTITDRSTSLPVEGAEVSLIGSPFTAVTDTSGSYSFPGVVTGAYGLRVFRYGYQIPPDIPITIETGAAETRDVAIEPAPIFVDFSDPSGWTVVDEASAGNPGNATGSWEFGEPLGTYSNGIPVQPETDHTLDPEDQCAVTGNASGGQPSNDDVDSLTTRLLSPVYDLSGMTEPHVFYYRWYGAGAEEIEPFEVEASSNGGASWLPLEIQFAKENFWKGVDFDLSGVLGGFQNVRIRFTAQDPDDVQLVEAAVDDFTIYDAQGVPVGLPGPRLPRLGLELSQNAPNPFGAQTRIAFAVPETGYVEISVYDVRGARVATVVDEILDPGPHAAVWNGRTLAGETAAPGVYFVKLLTKRETRTRKMIRLY